VKNMVVYPEMLQANLELTGRLWASEGVLLALVDKGIARQEAYVMVQRNAMRAFAGEGDFKQLLKADPEIRGRLTEEAIDAQFDLDHALAHVDVIIDRALQAKGE